MLKFHRLKITFATDRCSEGDFVKREVLVHFLLPNNTNHYIIISRINTFLKKFNTLNIFIWAKPIVCIDNFSILTCDSINEIVTSYCKWRQFFRRMFFKIFIRKIVRTPMVFDFCYFLNKLPLLDNCQFQQIWKE